MELGSILKGVLFLYHYEAGIRLEYDEDFVYMFHHGKRIYIYSAYSEETTIRRLRIDADELINQDKSGVEFVKAV